MAPRLPLLIFLIGWIAAHLAADPLLTSWYTENHARYARIYASTADAIAGNDQTAWIHPNGGNSQTAPAYSGVNEISYTPDWIYVKSSGLGSHVMGPWYRDNQNPNLGIFVNWPGNTAAVFRIPRTPVVPAPNQTLTAGGAVGIFVDGVAQFDSRDAFSYSAGNNADAGPGTNFNGDGYWNRDAYVNEGLTFDPAFAHQAGGIYHYHANPPGLRHLLGDSVTYNPATHTYSETPNGQHSPILGWCRDGLPIYGPYGYSDSMNPASAITRMRSGFQMRDGTNGTVNLTTNGRSLWPAWADRVYNGATPGAVVASPLAGPAVSAGIPLGHYLEDYAYLGDLGQTQGVNGTFDLDEHNARFCVTPEFPNGTWAYFVSIEANGTPKYPYNLGRTFKGAALGQGLGAISEPTTVHWHGGPDAAWDFKVSDIQVDEPTGDVTLTWNALEGGTYEVESSTDLSTWSAPFASLTSQGPQQDEMITDAGAAAGTAKKYYRVGLNDIATYDDTGYGWVPPQYPSVTLGNAPPNLANDPIPAATSISGPAPPSGNGTGPVIASGITSTRVERFGLDLDYDITSLAAGVYTVETDFNWNQGPQTGTFVVADNGQADNVLLIILDDWGIDSSDLYNTNPAASLPPMPTIQSLANNGVLFANAYAQPTCSPTRANIMTGRYSFRHGVGTPGVALDVTETTIAEVFRDSTSHYQLAGFGKWHLSGGGAGTGNAALASPRVEGGWPYFEGTYSNIPDYSQWDKIENDTLRSGVTDYATTVMTDDVIGWVGSTDPSRPWFAWLAYHVPHTPYHAPPTNLHSYTGLPPLPAVLTGADRRLGYEAALEALDTEVARLLATIDLNTTNVIVIGDNGTPGGVVQQPYHNFGGRGHAKGSLYEGGTHVPLLIAGPAVNGGGRTSNALVHCTDLFATILELGGLPSAGLGPVSDSVSLVDVLANTSTTAHNMILVENFGNQVATDDVGRAVFDGTYKVVEYENGGGTGVATYELYHIPTDENEEDDLNDGSLTTAESAALSALQNALATDSY